MDGASANNDSWVKWCRHILIELQENKSNHREITRIMSEVQSDIAVLKYKSGLWGAVGGLISVLVTFVIAYAVGLLK